MVSWPQIPRWLGRQYPFMPQAFVTAGGARMSYLDEGPRSDEVLERLGLSTAGAVEYMAFARTTWEGKPLTVQRPRPEGQSWFSRLFG